MQFREIVNHQKAWLKIRKNNLIKNRTLSVPFTTKLMKSRKVLKKFIELRIISNTRSQKITVGIH